MSENEVSGISVIIAHYNQPTQLKKCLEGLYSSRYPKFEVIVIDDKSPADPAPIVEKFPVRLIKQSHNVGSGMCKDIGARAAQYEILFFIDADIIAPADAFEKIDQAIRCEGYDGMVGVVAPRPLEPSPCANFLAFETHYLGAHSSDEPHRFFISLCGAIRKEVYLQCYGMYHRVLDDMEFATRLPADVKLKHQKDFSFFHHYPLTRVAFEKFFIRSFHYLQLENRPPSPWMPMTRKLATFCGLASVICLPLLAFPGWRAVPLGSSLMFILLSWPICQAAFKTGGAVFAFQVLYFKFLFSIAIGLGAAVGLMKKSFEYLSFALIRASGPARIYLRKNSPTYIILYVTSRCNSRCSYCFQWEILNESKRVRSELSLLDYTRLARSLGPMEHITLGGGEPFLRRDIADIAITFYRYTGLRNLSIPSNGIRPDLLKAGVEKILTHCPKMTLKLSLSIDGVGHEHDHLRGARGNYEKLIESDQVLRELRKKYSNLYYIINTCYNALNQDTVMHTIQENKKRFDHDIQVTTFVRGSVADEERAKAVDINKYFDVVNYLEHIQTIERKEHAYALDSVHQALQVESRAAITQVLTEHKPKYLCTAGRSMVVIDDMGNVSPCEILPGKFSFGNLRDFDMNLSRLMVQAKVKQTQKRIRNEKCFCTWECAQLNSIAFSPKGWITMAGHMWSLMKRRRTLRSSGQTALKSFEEFKKENQRPPLVEKPGPPVHPMVLEGNALNSFNIEVSLGADGEVVSKPGMTDEELKKKRELWLRPVSVNDPSEIARDKATGL